MASMGEGQGVERRLMDAVRGAGQGHLVEDWGELSLAERTELRADLEAMDVDHAKAIFEASISGSEPSKGQVEAVKDVLQIKDLKPELKATWRHLGCKVISEGKMAIVLLAGGQGTRLGSSQPKGCYDVGLPSHKSLFQIQAERILKLQRLAAEATSGPGAEVTKPLFWYIMTSSATHDDTVAFFARNDFFGVKPTQVTFFQQGTLPCFTEDGKIIMETKSKVAKSPNGNGGVYLALSTSGALRHMREHGVECVDCYSVDNLLVRIGDPVFIGYCWEKGAECGSRVVAKAHPREKVGVFARRNGALGVVEYSEMDERVATSVDPATGQLNFNWGNICMHFFTLPFLEKAWQSLEDGALYHVAKKTIAGKDGPTQGIKLEAFIFDPFPLASKQALFEVVRAEHFAPVKNARGSPADSPDTARALLLSLHKRWVESAGGTVTCSPGVEVSPLLSYSGEGLEEICQGELFDSLECPLLQGGAPGAEA
ncbi:unnamed protein product [Ostreobium quekettii]|uniref:UDP-N-acetylglucosamine pyrophosphorylase n=1 Tax=Ostreobium quekettii TaxID=121088 RepID=A0A8S1IPE5_9CHLO|nr:unnamed protein product [Ostreobium quekettii]